jgi:ABC-type uncharacterized transport system auxiliary subunit
MKNIIFLLSVFFCVFPSCGERTIIRHYYLLELPEKSDDAVASAIPDSGVCEILDTEIPPAFAQLRIAVRMKSNEISYYQYNYWAMSPSDNLTFLLAQQVELARLFSRSQSGFLKKLPDYQIKSYVNNLEVLDDGDDYHAHLQMKMDLIDFQRQIVLVTHTFDRTQLLEERDLNLFASQISMIFQEEVNQFISKMRTSLNRSEVDLSPQ